MLRNLQYQQFLAGADRKKPARWIRQFGHKRHAGPVHMPDCRRAPAPCRDSRSMLGLPTRLASTHRLLHKVAEYDRLPHYRRCCADTRDTLREHQERQACSVLEPCNRRRESSNIDNPNCGPNWHVREWTSSSRRQSRPSLHVDKASA